MSDSKYTQGPWRIDDAEDATVYTSPDIVADDGQGIAYVHNGAEYFDPNDNGTPSKVQREIAGEAMANALIIAVAPEILEALEELNDYHNECGACSQSHDLQHIRAIIAKAKGQ